MRPGILAPEIEVVAEAKTGSCFPGIAGGRSSLP